MPDSHALTRFNGPVVFIDDEIEKAGSEAAVLRKEFDLAGLPVIPYLAVPDDATIRHWRALAFLVVDWDFTGETLPAGISVGETATEDEEAKVATFIAHVLNQVYCPVFVISAQSPDKIRQKLLDSQKVDTLDLDTRMTILSKSAVVDDVLAPLDSWVQTRSGYEMLRTWETAYEKAKNKMFRDLHNLHPAWPHAFWKAAIGDDIDPSYELVSTLTSNLLNRIDVLEFEEPIEGNVADDGKGASLRKVLHGRSVLLSAGLYPGVIMPGDLFGDVSSGAEPEVIWINLSPACHTIARGHPELADEIQLYLAKAHRLDIPTSNNAYDKVRDNDKSPNKAVLHALVGDHPYLVEFKESKLAAWGDVREQRIGRILPPYITKIQQLNSMFMQVQGLPSISKAFYDL